MRIVASLALLALACGNTDDVDPQVPIRIEIGGQLTCVIEAAASPDAGVDAAMDAGTDVGMTDAGMTDVGMVDVGMTDAGMVDVGMVDVGMSDVGMPDSGMPDTGAPDAGGVDDGELDPLIRPVCWSIGETPQRLNLSRPLRGRIFLGDPLCNVADGELHCFGFNQYGQVGNGTEDPVIALTRIVTRPVVGLAVNRYPGEGFTCALFNDGSVSCWGFGEAGQLGNGGLDNQNMPTRVIGITDAYLITSGSAHACVATADEEAGTTAIRCWGSGSRGQLGDGTTNDSPSPVTVNTSAPDDAPRLEAPVHLTAGAFHTCALDVDGEVWCWGWGDGGQIGDGSRVDRPRPTRVSFASLVEEGEPEPIATALAAGGNHNCALLDGGQVVCWGQNDKLQTGVRGGEAILSPTLVLEDGTFVAAGTSHSCAIAAGRVQCWGEGPFLGTGGTGDTATPRTVNF